MKMISKWFEELPEPYKTQALENWDRIEQPDTNCPHMSNALGMAFFWDETPQDHEYWHRLYLEYVIKERQNEGSKNSSDDNS